VGFTVSIKPILTNQTGDKVSKLIIRKASVNDVDAIIELVNHYAKKGLLLRKSAFKVYSKLQTYLVAQTDERMVGCVSLVVLWKDLAEICSLAVDENHAGKGIGKKLVAHCIEIAKKLEVSQLIALTYQDDFFKKLGFHYVDKDSFPRKLMWECLECPKLEECDEREYLINLDQMSGSNQQLSE
jgi:amino-acid N-acetyltransferase